MKTRKRSLGYQQALALLKEGERMVWHPFPASKATINGETVRYDAYLRLSEIYKVEMAR